jgi:hypothetical protein
MYLTNNKSCHQHLDHKTAVTPDEFTSSSFAYYLSFHLVPPEDTQEINHNPTRIGLIQINFHVMKTNL